MRNKREYSLLTKTTFFYLIFTFLAFLGSGLYLTSETTEFVNRDVEGQFKRLEHKLEHYIRRDGVPDRLRKSIQLTTLTSMPERQKYPVYTDTVMYNPFADERQRFRTKTVVLTVDGTHYRASMIKPVEDYLRLRDDIFGSMIPAFILLAAGIVTFNLLISGYLFRPFNAILDAMRTYSVGEPSDLEKIRTSTKEFNKMQHLFSRMTERIESDYRRLKEYTENMAHEMQTPLAIVRNKLERFLDDDEVMDEHGSEVKIMWDEINHLSRLGNTLNLITRIENREFQDYQSVRTKPVITKHVNMVEEFASLKSLDIRTDLSDEHRIRIDPYLLDILLKNLLWNAVRYAETEGPIRVRTETDVLIVSNYGPPLDFPPEELFERFQGGDENEDSLGLGLALVKKICDMNSLAIRYEYDDRQHIFRVSGENQSGESEE